MYIYKYIYIYIYIYTIYIEIFMKMQKKKKKDIASFDYINLHLILAIGYFVIKDCLKRNKIKLKN